MARPLLARTITSDFVPLSTVVGLFMPPKPRSWQCEMAIPSQVGAGRGVLDKIVGRLEQEHWPKHDVFGVQLAMEEALINAIKHGNRLDPTKQVHVLFCLSPDVVRIEIVDEGPGFDPVALPDPTDPRHIESPGGRGVLLMRRFMSRVEFHAAGNHVVMEKQRSAAG